MTPEELKQIADKMGYEGFLVKDGRKNIAYHIFTEDEKPHQRIRKNIIFDPTKNNDQLVKVMNLFFVCVDRREGKEKVYAQRGMTGEWVCYPTLAEAVCYAVLAEEAY